MTKNSKKLRKFDKQELLIVEQLIRDPRLSDNKISQFTSIPVKTVNRKRKKLEEENLINYMLNVNNSKDGTKCFNSSALFIISMKYGISRKDFKNKILNLDYNNIKHFRNANIGEQNGRIVFSIIIESRAQEDITEIYNSELIPKLNYLFGEFCIHNSQVIYLHDEVLLHHNYLPNMNMEKGVIKKDWPKNKIFVSE